MGVVGRRVGCRVSEWSQMDQHGAKRIPKGSQKRPKWSQRHQQCAKRQSNKQKITMFRKGRFKERSGRKIFGFLSIFARRCRPKGAFLEIPKIGNGTKIQLFSKDGSFEPKGATKHPRLMEIEFRTVRKLELMI